MNSKMETISIKFAGWGAAKVFVNPFLPQKQLFLEFLPGGMKFATQISPLLN